MLSRSTIQQSKPTTKSKDLNQAMLDREDASISLEGAIDNYVDAIHNDSMSMEDQSEAVDKAKEDLDNATQTLTDKIVDVFRKTFTEVGKLEKRGDGLSDAMSDLKKDDRKSDEVSVKGRAQIHSGGDYRPNAVISILGDTSKTSKKAIELFASTVTGVYDTIAEIDKATLNEVKSGDKDRAKKAYKEVDEKAQQAIDKSLKEAQERFSEITKKTLAGDRVIEGVTEEKLQIKWSKADDATSPDSTPIKTPSLNDIESVIRAGQDILGVLNDTKKTSEDLVEANKASLDHSKKIAGEIGKGGPAGKMMLKQSSAVMHSAVRGGVTGELARFQKQLLSIAKASFDYAESAMKAYQ